MSNMQASSLGRGLSALLGPDVASNGNGVHGIDLQQADIRELIPGHCQPREEFSQESLAQLVQSIQEKGVIQPIIVRPVQNGLASYEIIAGERRWRAAKAAGLQTIPVIVKDYSDKDAMEIALIENIQREDLNAIEEGNAYKKLMEEFDYRQEDLAKVIGKSRSHIANLVRLTSLPIPVQNAIKEKTISVGHGRALINAKDPLTILNHVVLHDLNVRQTEKFVQNGFAPHETQTRYMKNRVTNPEIQSIEEKFHQVLGMRVRLTIQENKGDLTIYFKSFDQLDQLFEFVSKTNPTHRF